MAEIAVCEDWGLQIGLDRAGSSLLAVNVLKLIKPTVIRY